MPENRDSLHIGKLGNLIERIHPTDFCRTWDSFAISLFWTNPNVSQSEWIEKLLDHESAKPMLEDTFHYVNIRSFFNFFPFELFHATWPNMRLHCVEKMFHQRALYDLAWSLLATGVPLVPPMMTWFDLEDGEKATVVHAARSFLRGRRIPCNADIHQPLIDRGFLQEHEGRILPGEVHHGLRIRWPRRKVTYRVVKTGRILESFQDVHI